MRCQLRAIQRPRFSRASSALKELSQSCAENNHKDGRSSSELKVMSRHVFSTRGPPARCAPMIPRRPLTFRLSGLTSLARPRRVRPWRVHLQPRGAPEWRFEFDGLRDGALLASVGSFVRDFEDFDTDIVALLMSTMPRRSTLHAHFVHGRMASGSRRLATRHHENLHRATTGQKDVVSAVY